MRNYVQELDGLVCKLGAYVQAALAWWIEGLWAGVPRQVRDRWFVVRDELLVRFDGGHILVTDNNVGGEPILTAPLDACEQGSIEVCAELQSKAGWADVTVVLPDSARLTSSLSLPAATETNLSRVLYYELDRLTPFDVDLCVFDYVIRERDLTKDRIAVEFALIDRRTLDRYLRLLKNVGLSPSTVTVRSEGGHTLPLNLLDAGTRIALPKLKTVPLKSLAGAAALAMVAALYLPLERYEALLENFENTAALQREQAVAVRTRLDAERERTAGIEFLNDRRRNYERPIELLAELTDALQDDTWLERFKVSQAGLEIQGESSAPYGVLELVESTELLEGAEFQAPVSRSENTGKQRFSIVARLAGGG
jgi:general secretion pathway protein L